MRDPAAEIASGQHGAVARWQLRAAGLGEGAIDHRIATGRLHPVHRGVYLVGHRARAPLADEAAALLACGPNSVLSHRTAAWFWELIEDRPDRVEVTVSGRARARRAGLGLHRTNVLPRDEVRIREGMVFTAPARTLLDLAAVLHPGALADVSDRARDRRIVRETELSKLFDRYRGRRGTRVLREHWRTELDSAATRSRAERRMLALISSAGLPRPRVNARVAGYEVDLYWPEHGVTWRQLTDDPAGVVARLAAALARVL